LSRDVVLSVADNVRTNLGSTASLKFGKAKNSARFRTTFKFDIIQQHIDS